MWGFLATSHDPTTDNENVENKQYFSLGLLANLEDILRLVYNRSTILGIFYPFDPLSSSQYGIPLGTLDGCWAKNIYLNFMWFELPRNLDVYVLKKQMTPCWPYFSCTCGSE